MIDWFKFETRPSSLRKSEMANLKGWFTCQQICHQDLLVEHYKSGLISHFGLPFRQRNATCKFLAAPEDYRVLHKSTFRGCPIIHSLSNGVVGETMNKPYKINVM